MAAYLTLWGGKPQRAFLFVELDPPRACLPSGCALRVLYPQPLGSSASYGAGIYLQSWATAD